MTTATAIDWQRIRRLAAETVWTNLVLPKDPPPITGETELDRQWRQLAEDQGYRRRPLVDDVSRLKTVGRSQHRLQPQAVDAIHALQDAAGEAGHQLMVTSAYRDHQYQAEIFLKPLVEEPLNEEAVAERLRWSAIPGYSWHHTGYTVDLREGDYTFEQFINSEGYRWLAADNYLWARTYGWIPNYPPGVQDQGPDPEPWEFIWVGPSDRLIKTPPKQPSRKKVGALG